MPQALEELCRKYWHPIYSFVRRRGHSSHDAQDLTQGFFSRLLERGYLRTVDSLKGRFRSFLLTSLKWFLANEWEKAYAAKRGGASCTFSLDESSGPMAEKNALTFTSEPFRAGVAAGEVHDGFARVLALVEHSIDLVDNRGRHFEFLRQLMGGAGGVVAFGGISGIK
ncbi:MAG: DNA-directed RNA polymerase specialized sigma24 family protein [Limisphaerales bacterium]